MKKIYSTPFAELAILCKEDVMSASVQSGLALSQEGLGNEIDFNDFIK